MTTKLNIKQALTAGAMAAATAAIVNAVLFFIFHAAGIIVDTVFIQPNQPMTVVPIILSSAMPSILGALVFFLFEKYSANGYKNFRILAFVLMIVTFANPFMGIPNISVAYGIVLNVMHVVVVAALLYFISKSKAKNS